MLGGGIGFTVGAGVLLLCLAFTPLGPFTARILAIATAMFCTWQFNRNFTFNKSGRSLGAESARYGSVGLTTALVNYGVYSGLLLMFPNFMPLIALILGSASATIVAWLGYSKFVFSAPK